jgi:hypothetical protein
VLEGHDLGAAPKESRGDDDYEYFRTVTAQHVPAVLLWLIKERFDSEGQFVSWLRRRAFPARSTIGSRLGGCTPRHT